MASEIFPIRTDLAVETQESIKKRESEPQGKQMTMFGGIYDNKS